MNRNIGSLLLKLITFQLSLIAGSADVISFLGLNGLFVSHITGNLVILTVRIIDVGQAPTALLIALPVFILALGLSKIFVHFLEEKNFDSLFPLLILHFLFLLFYLILGIHLSPSIGTNSLMGILAGMLGVCAMAVQNALMQLSLTGLPTTAVMTTNVTRFVLACVDIFLSNRSTEKLEAYKKIDSIWPAIVGFIAGCGIGGFSEAAIGLKALFIPMFFSILALMTGFFL